MINQTVNRSYKVARCTAVTVVGSTALAVGVVLIVLNITGTGFLDKKKAPEN